MMDGKNESSGVDQAESREEYLAWCKERALEYCRMGRMQDAFASMASDMEKHPQTHGHSAIKLGFMLMLNGSLNAPGAMEHFIRGFH